MPDLWKMKRVLFATDFLESSRLALDYAVAIASHFNATLVMLHVAELSNEAREVEVEKHAPSVSRRLAEERLASLASGVQRAGLVVEMHVIDGIACETILKNIKPLGADLLVIGIHGVHRGLEHLLIGSNAERILLSAECPVLTIGAHVLAGVEPSFRPKEILFLSDLTQEAVHAAPYALRAAEEFQAPIRILHLVPEMAAGNRTLQKQLVAGWDRQMLSSIETTGGDPRIIAGLESENLDFGEMLAAAQSHAAALIVLGVKPQTRLGRHLHTSCAYQVLAKAACPVLTIGRDFRISNER